MLEWLTWRSPRKHSPHHSTTTTSQRVWNHNTAKTQNHRIMFEKTGKRKNLMTDYSLRCVRSRVELLLLRPDWFTFNHYKLLFIKKWRVEHPYLESSFLSHTVGTKSLLTTSCFCTLLYCVRFNLKWITLTFFCPGSYLQYPCFRNWTLSFRQIFRESIYSVLYRSTFGFTQKLNYSFESSWLILYQLYSPAFLPFFLADPRSSSIRSYSERLWSSALSTDLLWGTSQGFGCTLRVVVMLKGEPSPQSEVVCTLEQVFWFIVMLLDHPNSSVPILNDLSAAFNTNHDTTLSCPSSWVLEIGTQHGDNLFLTCRTYCINSINHTNRPIKLLIKN